MTFFQRLRILPLLVLVATLTLMVRLGEFQSGMTHAGIAFAQQEVDTPVPPLPSSATKVEGLETPDEKPAEEKITPAKEAEASPAAPLVGPPVPGAATTEPAETPAMPGEGEGEKVDWKDAGDAEFEYSEIRADLYKDLVERRETLDQREKELSRRQAILEAAERELDQKLREMTAVRNEIEGLLKQQSDEEQTRVNSLVRIYEGMKPADAARIFNTLDMDVLISVIARMSERKSAPILAEMSPERARAVTILLAQQKEIPDIPPQ